MGKNNKKPRDIICGIYCIENILDGKKYIGQSVNILDRWYRHKYELKNKKSNCLLLQRAWDAHGENNFKFWIVEKCDNEISNEELTKLEIKYMQEYDTLNPKFGYNITLGNTPPMKGKKASEETREKQRISRIGKTPALGMKHTDEWKENNSKLMMGNQHALGHKWSEEEKQRMSNQRKGHKAWNKGISHSEGSKEKISNANVGKKKRKESSSKYVGVCWDNKEQKWMSNIRYKKSYFLGHWDTEEEAALAYNKKAIELLGDKAKLNIINEKDK